MNLLQYKTYMPYETYSSLEWVTGILETDELKFSSQNRPEIGKIYFAQGDSLLTIRYSPLKIGSYLPNETKNKDDQRK